MHQYPALAEFNKKMTAMVDYVSEQNVATENSNLQSWHEINRLELGEIFGIDLESSGSNVNLLCRMLSDRAEIRDFILDGYTIRVDYIPPNSEQSLENIGQDIGMKMDMQ